MRTISDIDQRPVGTLTENPRNARTHSKKQIAQLSSSIRRFGFVSPILIDEQGVLIAGHGRLAAAKELNLETVPTIAVRGLSDAEKRMLLIADNRIAENAGWDRGRLAIELQELSIEEGAIELMGFEIAEADQIILDHEEHSQDSADEVTEPDSGPTVTVAGDLWILGNHRVLCGDALKASDDELLCGDTRADMVFTDPPYNLAIRGLVGRGRRKHREFAMASGEMSGEQFRAFLRQSLAHAVACSRDGALHYVCMDWRHIDCLVQICRELYGELVNVCVWVKSNAGQGSFYRSQHELVVVARVGQALHRNNVELGRHGRNRSNVWPFAGVNAFRKGRLDELTVHPTVKPVALISEAIKDCTRRGDRVLDVFGGSGSTLLACEKIGRRALLLEIDPTYVDVTIRRWQAYTGKDAVHAFSGETFHERSQSGAVAEAETEARTEADAE